MSDFIGAPRQTAVGFTIGSLGFVGCGQKGYSEAFKDFYSFDPIANTWISVGDVGDKGRAWACASAASGKAYIGTGWDFGATFFKDWWEFTPQSTVSIAETENLTPTIYNNMLSNTLDIYFTNNNARTITIMSIDGKAISTQSTKTKKVSVSISTLSAGIYILETKSNASNSKQKFIIR